MGQQYIIAGVANAQLVSKVDQGMIATAKTLTESAIKLTLSAQDITGGLANQLLGQYFHTSKLAITLTDALFNMNYMASQLGTTIQLGGTITNTVEVTTTVANQITITDTPQAFLSYGTIGWYRLKSSKSAQMTKITFVGSTASVANLPVGSVVCVEYIKSDSAAEVITIPSAAIPAQTSLILTLPIFKAGIDNNTYSEASRVGSIEYVIDTYQLDGNMDLALTASGTTTSAISGMAIATQSTDCNATGGTYGHITKTIFNANPFDALRAIAVVGSDIDLAVGAKTTLEVQGIAIDPMITNKKLTNTDLTLVSKTPATATIASTGEITAIAAGTSIIEVSISGYPKLTSTATVTVA